MYAIDEITLEIPIPQNLPIPKPAQNTDVKREALRCEKPELHTLIVRSRERFRKVFLSFYCRVKKVVINLPTSMVMKY